MRKITFFIPLPTLSDLDHVAITRDVSYAQIIREALDRYLPEQREQLKHRHKDAAETKQEQ